MHGQAATDPKTKQTEMIMTLKNVAIFGALVMLFGYECERPGACKQDVALTCADACERPAPMEA